MEPKITLTANGTEYVVQSGNLRNWADVMCSLTRSDYGGVVRKFTSQFDFVGNARDYLLGLYLEHGFGAQCELAIYVCNDSWEQVRQFGCPLDFSTLQWDDYSLSVSSVDSSLSAKIKAEGGTKHEMTVGTDIIPDGTFHFDRLPIKENATYKFTMGDTDEATGAISVRIGRGELPWLGNVGSEISVGKAVLYKDDQNPEDGGYVIQVQKDMTVDLSWLVEYDTYNSGGADVRIVAEVINGTLVKSTHVLGLVLGGSYGHEYLGSFPNEAALPVAGNTASIGKWAKIGSEVWIIKYNGSSCYWANTHMTQDECFRDESSGSVAIALDAGDKVRINAAWSNNGHDYSFFRLFSSSFVFSWTNRGDVCDIPVFTPKTVGDAILRRITGDDINAEVVISDRDPRIARTRIMAAESVRGISEAKLYTSFKEFADWIETVFGYTYVIGEIEGSRFSRTVSVGSIVFTPYTLVTSKYTGEVDPANIVYIQQRGMFGYYNPQDSRYYISFDGWQQYMNEYNRPLTDVIYDFSGSLYYFEKETEGTVNTTPQPYRQVNAGADTVKVSFVHRSELFMPSVAKIIDNTDDLIYKVNSSRIFSSVVVGYEKKEYDSVNGRDEFNFSNTYSTGCSVSDKKLTLISKYRADSYGIEFTAQKRGKETTDNKADQDVFFAFCRITGTHAYPDRTANVSGTLSDQVFNAAYSPRACVMANAGFIGMQSSTLALAFASSEGNSSAVIDGVAADADITLDSPLLTCGEIEFSTDDQSAIPNMNDAVKVVSNGIEYIGFISDFDVKYFRPEPARYKLIVKSVTQL